ncbi:hypothetical protein BJX70DRAFT_115718 [Aspergillus crustosus]
MCKGVSKFVPLFPPNSGRHIGRQMDLALNSLMTAWSAFCDFALALFPILLFARIRVISLPTRIELSLLMGSGVVAGACAIVKTIRLGRLTTFTDATHQLGHLIVWNQTEMWVVFIVSCLPPTKVFFARLFDKVVNWVSFIFSQSWPRSPGEDVLRYL